MRQYNNILVIVEPKKECQLALKRAVEVARFNPKVKITALRLVSDFAKEIDNAEISSKLTTREDEDNYIRTELEKTVQETVAQVDNPKGINFNISIVIKRVDDVSVGMSEEADSGKYDLLMKSANHHKIIDSLFVTPHDWHLLRNSVIPVVIVKEHDWSEDSTIVVAVDFTSTEKQHMNVILLREAQLLATITKCPIHIVNSAPVVMPTVMLEVPNYAPELYADSILAEHKRRILAFAQHHGIREAQCHIAEGMPDDVIPKLCKKLNAKTVFIGTQGRSGVKAALVGNTCEEILDFINADLFVLNRKTMNNDSE